MERCVYVKLVIVFKNGIDILIVDCYNIIKIIVLIIKELIERVFMFENELNLFSEVGGLLINLSYFKKEIVFC